MQDFFYRTEDIKAEEILEFFVENSADRSIINALKSRNPVILVGSRGVGKSFLLQVAEQEQSAKYEEEKILPVYVTFSKSILLNTEDPEQFSHWMLARLCSRIIRSLKGRGLLTAVKPDVSVISGNSPSPEKETEIEKVVLAYENSFKNNDAVDYSKIPTSEDFKDAIEDICGKLGINRISVYFDEVAHILRPEQQRQFFTLFRDLRSPYITCNAAVYPGVTSYGEVFQPIHDATFLTVERDIVSPDYINNMREIVEKQADSGMVANIVKNGENFAVLAYAANGNPRLLLKTVARCPKLNSSEVNQTIRDYYRSDIWAEHSGLVNAFSGHKVLIDWGRKFIEGEVLKELQAKNYEYIKHAKNTSCYFWVHRDCPEPVKEALKLLAYTGIITSQTDGIKATRAEIGTRYAVNLGCLLSLESHPAATGLEIAKNLTPRRMTEYGANNPIYSDIILSDLDSEEINWSKALATQLTKSITVLDITEWQKSKLTEAKLDTVGKILDSDYEDLQQIYYIGQKRSRRIFNAAQAAIYEYLSG